MLLKHSLRGMNLCSGQNVMQTKTKVRFNCCCVASSRTEQSEGLLNVFAPSSRNTLVQL